MYDSSRKYEMRILVRGKTIADEYYHTDGKTYIEGRNGSEYVIELMNRTANRAAFVISVDGLSVMDGQPAGTESASYIVPAYGNVHIPGWRRNDSKIASFVFFDSDNSYSNQIGHGKSNIGVIGAMVFEEQPTRTPFDHARYAANNPYAFDTLHNTRSCIAVDDQIGTGYGREQQFHTHETNFVYRSNNPDAIIALYYDTSKGLERRGIQLRYRADSSPDPFPMYKENPVSCPPPPSWAKK